MRESAQGSAGGSPPTPPGGPARRPQAAHPAQAAVVTAGAPGRREDAGLKHSNAATLSVIQEPPPSAGNGGTRSAEAPRRAPPWSNARGAHPSCQACPVERAAGPTGGATSDTTAPAVKDWSAPRGNGLWRAASPRSGSGVQAIAASRLLPPRSPLLFTGGAGQLFFSTPATGSARATSPGRARPSRGLAPAALRPPPLSIPGRARCNAANCIESGEAWRAQGTPRPAFRRDHPGSGARPLRSGWMVVKEQFPC